MEWGRTWLADFNVWKAQLVSFDWSNNTGTIEVKMDWSVVDENRPLRYWSYLCFLNWIAAKSASKKLGALIRSIKFIYTKVALYL